MQPLSELVLPRPRACGRSKQAVMGTRGREGVAALPRQQERAESRPSSDSPACRSSNAAARAVNRIGSEAGARAFKRE